MTRHRKNVLHPGLLVNHCGIQTMCHSVGAFVYAGSYTVPVKR